MSEQTSPQPPSEHTSPDDLNRAKTLRAAKLSPIWIVPIVAVLIGVWLVYDSYLQRGILVTLSMPTAEGIEAGKTTIKTRNVDIGQVEQVRLSDDLNKTLIYARIDAEAEKMLVEDSRFWVVKPRIGREGISGLNTVLSGAYIQLQPGGSNRPETHFDVQDQPPVTLDNSQGIRLNLVSQLGNSLSVSDPVTYQGLVVGRVETAKFDSETKQMRHELFIEKPFDELVTENTRFWSAKGFDFNLTSAGVQLNIASLEALISGGVTFGVLESVVSDPIVKPDHEFVLYANEDAAKQGSYDLYLEYVLMIEDTVRGLVSGAPVEYRGIRIGTVMEVPWQFTSEERNAEQGYSIPVLIRLEPQRLDPEGEFSLNEWQQRLLGMMRSNLRASLKSGNLLTGSLFVDLNFIAEAEKITTLSQFEGKSIIPSTSIGLAQLESKVSNLLDKLNALEVEPLLAGLEQNMQTSNTMLKEVQSMVEDFRMIAQNPALRSLPENINQLVTELQKTLDGFGTDAPIYQELTRSLQQLDKLLRDMQPAAKKISEQPSSLIFDRSTGTDPMPTAPSSGDAP